MWCPCETPFLLNIDGALLVKGLALRLFGWNDALHIFYVLYSYMRPLSDNYKDTGYSKIPLG
jgi:hypothetical protein